MPPRVPVAYSQVKALVPFHVVKWTSALSNKRVHKFYTTGLEIPPISGRQR